MNKKNELRVENLSFQYLRAKSSALNNINFILRPGEKVLLMGKTCAGKSTLCYCLKGLIPKIIPGTLSGNILFKEKEILAPEDSIGLVLQEFEAQIFNSTVELEIAFGLQNIGTSKSDMQKIVAEIIKKTGLIYYEKTLPLLLSGGQKQRLAIASIWAMNPDIFILDEPMTDLDTEGRYSVFAMIMELSQTGKSVLLVDNELDNAMNFDRIILMDHGEIIHEEAPENIILQADKYASFGIRPPDRIVLFNALNLNLRNALTHEQAISELKSQFHITLASRLYNHAAASFSTEKIIEMSDATYNYPHTKNGIWDINLSIHKGEFISLIGTNGSGKTTLLKLITGIAVPDKGEVKLNGKAPNKIRPQELPKHIGFVFQNPDHQIFTSSIKEELILSMKLAGMDENLYTQKMSEVLKIVKLEGLENEDPFLLTKGERQKVAVASALVNDPELLILDEPTTGLDYQEQLSVLSMLKKLNEAGKTIIITTHSLWIVEEYAHRCIIMHQGRIAIDNTVQNTFSDPDTIRSVGLIPPELSLICHSLNLPFMHLQELISFIQKFINPRS